MHESTPPSTPRPSTARRLFGRAPRTRSVIAATGLLVVCGAPLASARIGDNLREGVRNGTTSFETEIVSNIRSTTATKGGYATRQSNLSDSGGGAIYGCRSKTGGSAAKPLPQNPCVRANNLSTGYAFEFHASQGPVAGLISAGAGGDAKKPFVTNATGVATGLNADRVDGMSAADILNKADTNANERIAAAAPFAQVKADGTAGETRGLPATGAVTKQGAGDYDVIVTGDLAKCALSTAITGTSPGQIAVVPTVAADKKTTTVDVRTFDGAGAAADRAFHLTAAC